MAIKGSQIKHLTQATLKGTCTSAVNNDKERELAKLKLNKRCLPGKNIS